MAALLPLENIRRLTGFGRASASDGYVFEAFSATDVEEVLKLARETERQVTLRAAARSYGDAATGAECIILDLSQFNRILAFDQAQGIIEVEPGATLEQIWQYALPTGWWLPVVSGTTKTTLGGALAMNIHGKNNFLRGPLGEHVTTLEVLTPAGETWILSPGDELFNAVISSAGLLGIIMRVKLQLKRITSGDIWVEAVSCRHWDDQFQAFKRFEGKREYVVSWIDCFVSGATAGRGILHAARHEEEAPGAESLQLGHQALPTTFFGVFPKSSMWRFLKIFNNRAGMRLVNFAKHQSGKMFEHGKSSRQSLAAYNFLLDYAPGWERAYLPGGLIQCQFFIPRENARDAFEHLVNMQQEAKLESFLAVMKRHRPDNFLFSHAVDGYSLALDFKVTEAGRERLWDLAKRMQDYALGQGGRFYFAKDSTLTAEQAARFLGPDLAKCRELKGKHDPENLLTSDLARRLKIG